MNDRQLLQKELEKLWEIERQFDSLNAYLHNAVVIKGVGAGFEVSYNGSKTRISYNELLKLKVIDYLKIVKTKEVISATT